MVTASNSLRLTLIISTVCLAVANYRRVCYFTSWAPKRKNPDARMRIEDIDPFLCTHIIYAFATISVHQATLVGAEWDDEGTPNNSKGGFEKLVDMKKKRNPRLKVMISVGGATAGSWAFNEVMSSPDDLLAFVNNVVIFLREWDFDGLDIDWEFPERPGRLAMLARELRQAFDRETVKSGRRALLLSAAVGVSEKHITDTYDVPELIRHVDFVNLMTYDFHGSWDTFTGGNGPLFSRANDARFNQRNSVKWGVDGWIWAGAPSRKLNIGIAAQGRTFTLQNANNTAVGAPISGAGAAGPLMGEPGVLSYFEVCGMLSNGAKQEFDQQQKFPFLHKGRLWVSYDNPRSVVIKMNWMIHKRLGGVFIWSLDLDDYTGYYCRQGNSPLTSAIRNTLESRSYRIPNQYRRRNTASSTSQKWILIVTVSIAVYFHVY